MGDSSAVRVIYDFNAQPGSMELTISAGEILTVTRRDVGDGWWEGTNSRGQSGLFPEGYVEPVSSINENQYQEIPSPMYDGQGADDWDDDWDDDDDSQASNNADPYQPQVGGHLPTSGPSPQKPVAPKKSYNRFSMFVKSGGEDYILGTKNKVVPSDEQVTVIEESPGVFRWAPNDHPYECRLDSPKKESKLKGLKSYIAYQLTPSFNSIQVSRRYKHFDWLQERLVEKFISIPVPPLPDKQVTGRYQEDFIRHRLAQLQLWVDRICKHPVLAQSDVWMHFMTCTDEKRWKQGKRKAEKDEFVGASFFYAVQAPPGSLDLMTIEKRTDHFSRFIGKLDDSVKHLFHTCQDQSKKYAGPYKREFTRVSTAFAQLADALASSGVPNEDRALNEAIRNTSSTYDTIGKMYEEQPRLDFEPMSDVLHEYKGILSNFPDILQLQKGALNKKREHQKLQEEGKVDSATAASVYRRADIVSYATLAEIDYFQKQRVIEFREMIKHFLKQQILFYENITDTLRQNFERYEQS